MVMLMPTNANIHNTFPKDHETHKDFLGDS
jgi:hypothetical protein